MPSLGDASVGVFVVLGLAAFVIGVTKTAVSSAGAIAVVLFATVIPARESTGAILPLLIAGDLVAVGLYSRHADRGVLLRLIPGVLPGLALGAWFIAWADDSVMRRCTGLVLLSMGLLQIAARTGRLHPDRFKHPVATGAVGALAGFSTTTANAAGPVTAMYLLMTGLSATRFLGTAGWFFLCVNLCKVPVATSLGLISPAALVLDALLLPAMGAGAWLGYRLAARLKQQHFETLTLAASMLSAALLLL